MECIDGGLRPAVDGQSQRENLKSEIDGRVEEEM